MPAGLQFFNEQGTIQFDTEMPNFSLVTKGTIQTVDVSEGTFDSQARWSLGLAENLPTFDSYAVSCSTSPVYGGLIGFESLNRLTVNAGPGSHTVTYYLFRSTLTFPPSDHGVGIEVYNTSGQVTFTTARRPLAVIAKHETTTLSPTFSEFRALPAGRTYAFIRYGSALREFRSLNTGGGDIGNSAFNCATAGCRTANGGYYLEEIRGNAANVGSYYNGGNLVVDVTGI